MTFYFVFHGIGKIYINYLWGDFGWWHEAIKRVSQGEIPYKDFVWYHPPLGLYIYGWLARVFGDSFTVLNIIPMIITIMIAFLVFLIARYCVPERLLPFMAFASIIMGISISNYGSETLALGMYSPAVPVGILISLICLFASIRYFLTASRVWLCILGITASAAILTKQDFWAPALVCFLFIAFENWQKPTNLAKFFKNISYMLIPAVLFLIVGISFVVIQSGFSAVPKIIGIGSGANIGINRLLPTGMRMLDSLLFSSIYVIIAILFMWQYRIAYNKKILVIICLLSLILVFLRLGTTYWIGNSIASGNNKYFGTITGSYFYGRATNTKQVLILTVKNIFVRGLAYSIPIFLTLAIFIAILWFFRKRDKAPLVKICLFLALWVLAARMRRLFEFTDVISLMIEPLFFSLAIQVICEYKDIHIKPCHHLIFSFSIIFIIVGIILFSFYEIQPRVRYKYETLVTKKGNIKIRADQVAEFKWLEDFINSVDPSGEKSLLHAPLPGALSYILNRQDKSPLVCDSNYNRINEELKKNQPLLIFDISMYYPYKWDKNLYDAKLRSAGYQHVNRPPANTNKPVFEVYVPEDMIKSEY
ncbi:hypothetical protein FJZ33_04470 [Candidatus Poribacteria bacterium]|nr:hypothetical protein [Candidatus Poribacteria bacterium]